ncbi:MAG: 50S ribosomal protein L35 [Candidatus Melainabacteria bacterium]|nr:50S ribosomal protein L35 [Candidatus Melainabacteria bacterium]
MPKMKTHKSGAKRYRLTATGKLIRAQAGRSHLNQKKSSRRKRRLDSYTTVHVAMMSRILSEELPYAKYARR